MNANTVLRVAALAEAATGLALATVPSSVGRLLLGEHLVGIAEPVARVAGMALIGLGIACWAARPLFGMLTYSVLATAYLAYLGLEGVFVGILLWPAVLLHLILSGLLIRSQLRWRAAARRAAS